MRKTSYGMSSACRYVKNPRWLKISVSRWHRRLARRDPEGAPRRRWYRGWWG